MIGSEFLDYLTKFQVATYVGVEDFADKFNFIITVTILLLCTTIVTVKQYMLKPISCYMATDLGGKNLLDYVENYCWVQGTVPLAYSGRIPETEEGWKKLEEHKLLYYQWVPFVLGLQCILFYLPRVIWQMICYNRAGTDIQHLVLSANQAVHADEKRRDEMVSHLAHTLEQMLFQQLKNRDTFRDRQRRVDKIHDSSINLPLLQSESQAPPPPKHSSLHKQPIGFEYFIQSLKTDDYVRMTRLQRLAHILKFHNYSGLHLSIGYLTLKILCLANSIGQLFLMQVFLGFTTPGYVFGVAILQNILSGQDWQATLVFPRVAYCYAPVKHLGTKINIATAQCVLPVNMLNEKIYIFLWWWVLLVSIVTAHSFLYWLVQLVSAARSQSLMRKLIRLRFKIEPEDEGWFDIFVHKFLRRDGILLIRMISKNAGAMITGQIVQALWRNYMLALYPSNLDKSTQTDPVEDKPNKPDEKSQAQSKSDSTNPPLGFESEIKKRDTPSDDKTDHQLAPAETSRRPQLQQPTNLPYSTSKPQQEKSKLRKVRKRFAKLHNLFHVSQHLGSRLYAIYLFIKFLYLINAIGQIYMMQSFLGLNDRNYTMFGLSIAHDILSGNDWEVSLVFPRVGFCVIPVRNMGATNYATAQCVLPVNMLNERIYIFLWFWIVLASTITSISIPIWFVRMSYQKSRYTFIKRYLRLSEQIVKKDKPMVRKFTRQFLKHDGIFLLRMISSNAGELICADIIRQLWLIFIRKKYYQLIPDDEVDNTAGRTSILVRSEQGDMSSDPTANLKSIEPSAPVDEVDDIAAFKRKVAMAV